MTFVYASLSPTAPTQQTLAVKNKDAQKRINLSPLAFYSSRCLPLIRLYVALGPGPTISVDLTDVGGTLATLWLICIILIFIIISGLCG